MKIIYTQPAEEELKAFQERQKSSLEQLVSEKKAVLGDDILEITASDIKELSRAFKPTGRSVHRGASISFVTGVYAIVGAGTTLVGLFFTDITSIIDTNPMRAITIFTGCAMMLASLVIRQWYAAQRPIPDDAITNIQKREREFKELIDQLEVRRLDVGNIVIKDIAEGTAIDEPPQNRFL